MKHVIYRCMWKACGHVLKVSIDPQQDEYSQFAAMGLDYRNCLYCPKCHCYMVAKEIKGYKSDHVCDARCTGAKGHVCECSCGGANHGSAYAVP